MCQVVPIPIGTKPEGAGISLRQAQTDSWVITQTHIKSSERQLKSQKLGIILAPNAPACSLRS
jgi:hypothetical protein